MMLAGMKVITSEWLTEPGEPVQVPRTWRERLFTRPWQPWRATRTHIPQVPSTQGYIINGDTVVLHPVRFEQLKRQEFLMPCLRCGSDIRPCGCELVMGLPRRL